MTGALEQVKTSPTMKLYELIDWPRIEDEIRLSGIDAPERKQPFGTRSCQDLAGPAFRTQVTLEWRKRDRHLADALARVGSPDEALHRIRIALECEQNEYGMFRTFEALALLLLDDLGSAQACIESALTRNPGNGFDYSLLTIVHFERGNCDQARATASRSCVFVSGNRFTTAEPLGPMRSERDLRRIRTAFEQIQLATAVPRRADEDASGAGAAVASLESPTIGSAEPASLRG